MAVEISLDDRETRLCWPDPGKQVFYEKVVVRQRGRAIQRLPRAGNTEDVDPVLAYDAPARKGQQWRLRCRQRSSGTNACACDTGQCT